MDTTGYSSRQKEHQDKLLGVKSSFYEATTTTGGAADTTTTNFGEELDEASIWEYEVASSTLNDDDDEENHEQDRGQAGAAGTKKRQSSDIVTDLEEERSETHGDHGRSQHHRESSRRGLLHALDAAESSGVGFGSALEVEGGGIPSKHIRIQPSTTSSSIPMNNYISKSYAVGGASGVGVGGGIAGGGLGAGGNSRHAATAITTATTNNMSTLETMTGFSLGGTNMDGMEHQSLPTSIGLLGTSAPINIPANIHSHQFLISKKKRSSDGSGSDGGFGSPSANAERGGDTGGGSSEGIGVGFNGGVGGVGGPADDQDSPRHSTRSAHFVPPHLLGEVAQGDAVGDPQDSNDLISTSLKRDQLKKRNSILQQTGFLDST